MKLKRLVFSFLMVGFFIGTSHMNAVLTQREAEMGMKKAFPSWSISKIQSSIGRLWDWMKLKGTQLTMSSEEFEANMKRAGKILDKPNVKRKYARTPDQVWDALPAGIKLKFINGESVSVGEVRSAIAGEHTLGIIYEKGGAAGAAKVGEFLVDKYGTEGLAEHGISGELGLPNLSNFTREEMLDAFRGTGSPKALEAAQNFQDTVRDNFDFEAR